MQIPINTTIPEIQLTFEYTKHRLGMRVWGDRMSLHALYEMISECWESSEDGMSHAEESSYVGVFTYFCYEVRHAFMGSRLVTLDGKAVKEWDDEMIQLFEAERDRFRVGLDFTWSHWLFIMASWWECLRHKACPSGVLEVMREFDENIERLLLHQSKRNFPRLEPYLHGAIYAANPYLMQTMEHVESYYLHEARFYERARLDELAATLECASYGTWVYNNYLAELKKAARKQKCAIEELRVNVSDELYRLEL